MTENEKDFDLLAFAKGRSRAKDSVELYMDEDAAKEMAKHLRYNKDGEVIGVKKGEEDDYQTCLDTLKESSVTIHLEGLHEGRVVELRGEYEIKKGVETDDDTYESWLVAVLAEMYQKTATSNGKETSKALTTADWFEFKKDAPRSQWTKLLRKVQEVLFISEVIDDGVDAGFSQKS